MIKFLNLLKDHSEFDLFWKMILERISINDPPFYSEIRNDFLYIDEPEGLNLKETEPGDAVNFCREKWCIPISHTNWKDIKREYVRALLLKKFSEKSSPDPDLFFSKLQILLSEKVITSEDVVILNGEIIRISNLDGVI